MKNVAIIMLILFVTFSYVATKHHDSHNTLPVCVNNEHVSGEWHHFSNFTAADKSFFCCGMEKNVFLQNPEECGTDDYDIDVLHWGRDKFNAIAPGQACYCDARDNTQRTLNRREQYEWIPHNCTLLKWNGHQFCHLLGNRTIVLVGDSTMQQTAATLMSMITSSGANCSTQIGMGRSNALYYSLKGKRNMFEFAKITQPDILIMNAGAHMHDMGDIYSIMENLKIGMPAARSDSPKTQFVWKTMNPGHVNCSLTTEPLKQFVIDKNEKDEYEWHIHQEFDRVSKEYARNMSMKIIDMSPLYLRIDAHGDCLHYCLPGPINIFSNILLNMLHNKEL
jgi:hypothetical protein